RWAMAKGEESLKLELARRHARTPEQRAAVSPPPGPTRFLSKLKLSKPRSSGRALHLAPRQLPQHVLQDAAVLVVQHFLRRVDAGDRAERLAAVRPRRPHRQLAAVAEAGRDRGGQALDGVHFFAGQLQR